MRRNVLLRVTIAFLASCLLVNGLPVNAQNTYSLVGSTRIGSSPNCYLITQAGSAQTGAIWVNKLLPLTQSFEIDFILNFGNNPLGADGLVMVLQTQGNKAIGNSAGNLGYKGLSPSLGIEFDTYQNAGDPSYDHIAVDRDGITDHRLNKEFAPPVPISPTSSNVKDGRDHYVKVSWNIKTRILQVDVDCVSRINQYVDLVNDIFAGVQQVYWGFTAATGTKSNTHTVCFQNEVVLPDTLQACQKDTVTLTSPVSSANQYEWTPAAGLDDPHSRTPRLTTSTSQLYIVKYTDHCSQSKFDSVYVNVKTPKLDLGANRQACENEVIELDPVVTPANKAVTYHWSTSDTTRQLTPKTSGLYSLTIAVDACSVSDSVRVTFNPLPKRNSLTDTTYDCPGNQAVLLDPRITGAGLQFTWTPGGSKESTLMVNLPGGYRVKVSTEFGCSVEQGFVIRDNCPSEAVVYVPDAFTPNGDGINEVFEWRSNVDVEARMKIFNRWGEVIFLSDSTQSFWNGTCRGYPCSSDVYTWSLEYRPRLSKDPHWLIKRGEVALLK